MPISQLMDKGLKNGETTKLQQRGFPSAESSLVRILTTWNTWQVVSSKADFV